jgi:hypothetical protein
VLSNPDETIFLGAAEPFPNQSGQVSCALDLQIERAARPADIHHNSFWALPLRHSESLTSVIFPSALSRVSDDWVFAAEISQVRVGQLTQKAAELRIRIPRDFDAICLLLREPVAVGRGGWDLRARLQKESSIIEVEISPEGKQLRELVMLIGGLWRANIYFGRRLWRDVFTKMAGRDARQEENLRTEVSNTIWKGFENALTAEVLERIVPPTADSVLRRVGNRLPGRYILVNDLRRRCEAEQREYEQLEGDAQQRVHYRDGEINVSADRPPPLSIEDIQAGIDALVALNFSVQA